MGFYYFPWESLDRNEHYCMADTMGLVDLHRGTLDSMQDVRGALGDRTMLVIMDVVEETAIKCSDLDNTPLEALVNFEDSVVAGLDRSGLPFALVCLPEDVVSAADAQYAKKEYLNRRGEPLSFVDCLLLCAAMDRGNVDIMTADGALTEAVKAKCGNKRANNPRTSYYKRRRDTAWFIKVLTGTEVEWTEAGTMLNYASNEGLAVTLDVSKPEALVESCDVEGLSGAGEAIMIFFMVSQLESYCQCGTDGGKFKCTCPDFRYDKCSGLDKAGSYEFLGLLRPKTRNKLYAIVKSFQ